MQHRIYSHLLVTDMIKHIKHNLRLGVLGGMGTEASIYFQNIIAQKRGANHDQAHLPVVCITNPNIPDRTAYLLDKTNKNPVPELLKSIQDLEDLKGVYCTVMACNTAHAFHDILQKHTHLVILDMIKYTVDFIRSDYPDAPIGLLATTGTCKTGVYDRYFQKYNISCLKPDEYSQQHHVHASIYGDDVQSGIKGGEYDKSADLLVTATEILHHHGVNVIILGCTELPLVRNKLESALPHIHFIDPMEIVAQKAIDIHDTVIDKLSSNTVIKPIKSVLDLHTDHDIIDYITMQARIYHAKNLSFSGEFYE